MTTRSEARRRFGGIRIDAPPSARAGVTCCRDPLRAHLAAVNGYRSVSPASRGAAGAAPASMTGTSRQSPHESSPEVKPASGAVEPRLPAAGLHRPNIRDSNALEPSAWQHSTSTCPPKRSIEAAKKANPSPRTRIRGQAGFAFVIMKGTDFEYLRAGTAPVKSRGSFRAPHALGAGPHYSRPRGRYGSKPCEGRRVRREGTDSRGPDESSGREQIVEIKAPPRRRGAMAARRRKRGGS